MATRTPVHVRLRFLGTAHIAVGEHVITPDADRVFALLTRLSAPAGRAIGREVMLDTLWPGVADGPARHNLRQAVYKLRELGIALDTEGEQLSLDRALVTADWEAPTAHISGAWLEPYAPTFSEPMRTWVTTQRLLIHATLRPRLLAELSAARANGVLADAVRVADQLLRIDPMNEEATLVRVESMVMQGSKADALKLLDAYLEEVGSLGRPDALVPAKLLRTRIAERLPKLSYATSDAWHGLLQGRITEAGEMLRLVFETRSSRGAALLVSGPSGVGATRVVTEGTKSAVLQGMSVVEVECLAPDADGTLSSLPALIGCLLRLPGSVGVSPEALARLRALAAMSPRTAVGAALQADDLADLLAAVSEERPLLVVLDHAERLEPAALRTVLDAYPAGDSRLHSLVLVSTSDARDLAVSHGMRRAPKELALGPMPIDAIAAMLRGYAKERMTAKADVHIEMAATLSEGYPMYALEFLGALAEDVQLEAVPWKVKSAVEVRLAQLTADEREVLLAAVLLGKCATDERVAKVVGRRTNYVEQRIATLSRRLLIASRDGVLSTLALASDQVTSSTAPSDLSVIRKSVVRTLTTAWNRGAESEVFAGLVHTMGSLDLRQKVEQFIDDQSGTLVARHGDVQALTTLRSVQHDDLGNSATELLNGAVMILEARTTFAHDSLDANWKAIPRSLAMLPYQHYSVVYGLKNETIVEQSLNQALDPSNPVDRRLSSAGVAMSHAYHFRDPSRFSTALGIARTLCRKVGASRFHSARVDLIAAAHEGSALRVKQAARRLANESHQLSDPAARALGFRNALEGLLRLGPSEDQLVLCEAAIEAANSSGSPIEIGRTQLLAAECWLVRAEYGSAQKSLSFARERYLEANGGESFALADVDGYAALLCAIAGDLTNARALAESVAVFLAPECAEQVEAICFAMLVRLATAESAASQSEAAKWLAQYLRAHPLCANTNLARVAFLLSNARMPMGTNMARAFTPLRGLRAALRYPVLSRLGASEVWGA
jgi:DNA-binding SARP family transcriptional activator